MRSLKKTDEYDDAAHEVTSQEVLQTVGEVDDEDGGAEQIDTQHHQRFGSVPLEKV